MEGSMLSRARENSFPSVGKENDAQILQRREEEMVF
jgi:hypothetical protein